MTTPKRKILGEADKKLLSLAEKIAKAGKIIAGDSISKDYLVFHNLRGEITVTSDSGFEAILIGNAERGSRDALCTCSSKTHRRGTAIPRFMKSLLYCGWLCWGNGFPRAKGKQPITTGKNMGEWSGSCAISPSWSVNWLGSLHRKFPVYVQEHRTELLQKPLTGNIEVAGQRFRATLVSHGGNCCRKKGWCSEAAGFPITRLPNRLHQLEWHGKYAVSD